ncbi:MAG: DsrE family protein [Rhodoblastus sp.]|nr:DsrE family protein [Rhodoblastus sp.]
MKFARTFAIVGIAAASAVSFSLARADFGKKEHHIVFQVSRGDAPTMNLTLNNIVNVAQEYSASGDSVEIEVVAYGPGLTMLRNDNSPVKDRLKSIKASIPDVTFSACGNTLAKAEKTEGKKIELAPEARMVKAGVIRLAELQEKGWTYIKP